MYEPTRDKQRKPYLCQARSQKGEASDGKSESLGKYDGQTCKIEYTRGNFFFCVFLRIAQKEGIFWLFIPLCHLSEMP